MRTIPQRALRNHISQVLREVEAGERLRITVDGRPVAELVPVASGRSTFVAHQDLVQLLARAPLDPGFAGDVDAVSGQTVDEL